MTVNRVYFLYLWQLRDGLDSYLWQLRGALNSYQITIFQRKIYSSHNLSLANPNGTCPTAPPEAELETSVLQPFPLARTEKPSPQREVSELSVNQSSPPRPGRRCNDAVHPSSHRIVWREVFLLAVAHTGCCSPSLERERERETERARERERERELI